MKFLESDEQMTKPLVTVIIPTYNAGPYLRISVQSILDQTYSNLEILVYDDGSIDDSMSSLDDIQDSRIRISRHDNMGKSATLNRALDELTGEFYAVQDADDVSHPERIQRQLAVLQAEPDIAAVFCGHELVIDDRCFAPRFREKDRKACGADILSFRMPAHDPTGMFRVAMVGERRYETSLTVGEGLDFILRVGESYPLMVIGECLYSYRVHRNSLTKRVVPEERRRQLGQVYLRAAERRGLDVSSVAPVVPMRRGKTRALDNGVASDFLESAIDLRREGRWLQAVSNGLFCIRLCPFDIHYYKALLYALLPVNLRRWLRPSERAQG